MKSINIHPFSCWHISFYLLSFFVTFQKGQTQICPSGDVYFLFQHEVDEFKQKYPNCTEISGNLSIGGINVTNLAPLARLKKIKNGLSIRGDFWLTTLKGLDSLESIGHGLAISSNSLAKKR